MIDKIFLTMCVVVFLSFSIIKITPDSASDDVKIIEVFSFLISVGVFLVVCLVKIWS
jgi:hypothetical protein